MHQKVEEGKGCLVMDLDKDRKWEEFKALKVYNFYTELRYITMRI